MFFVFCGNWWEIIFFDFGELGVLFYGSLRVLVMCGFFWCFIVGLERVWGGFGKSKVVLIKRGLVFLIVLK